jgi:hypothetical protein
LIQLSPDPIQQTALCHHPISHHLSPPSRYLATLPFPPMAYFQMALNSTNLIMNVVILDYVLVKKVQSVKKSADIFRKVFASICVSVNLFVLSSYMASKYIPAE